ncbi:MAG: 16S rRNA (uracil(1498)-N(3))-methyltransferase [Myxococcales bacterium]
MSRRLFLPPDQIAHAHGGLVRLSADQARYLGVVLRLREGEAVEVFDGAGTRFDARIAGAGVDGLSLRLLGRTSAAPAPGPHLVLAQALSRSDKLDLVIQKATELGAARVIPFAAERSVVRLPEGRGAARAERWRRIAQEAARQCGRADVPAIDAPARWEDLFSCLQADPGMRGVLLDGGTGSADLAQAAHHPGPGPARVLIAVGPEGGFSAEEKERARAHGFAAASLGPLTLRTETAGLAALAILQHLGGSP